MGTTPIQCQARNYTSAAGSNYMLPSDDQERARLDTQHGVVTRCFGDKLILSPVTLKGGDKVLDSGTGACNWLLDLAQTLPSDIEFVGFDIEPNLFPKEPPPNIKLFQISVLDLPKDWTNTFQLIHQRFLISALTSQQWDPAINELFRVTKPGGWVEFCEFGPGLICPSHPDHKALQIFTALYPATDHVLDISLSLPDRLREAGFTEIHAVEVAMPYGKQVGQDGERARDAIIGVLRGLSKSVLSKGGLGIAESEEEFDKVVDDFERICDETPDTMAKYYTVYGRKPLPSSL